MLLFSCHHCGDLVQMTKDARQCSCGAVVGAITAPDNHFVSGSHSIFDAPDELLKAISGEQFILTVLKVEDKSKKYALSS